MIFLELLFLMKKTDFYFFQNIFDFDAIVAAVVLVVVAVVVDTVVVAAAARKYQYFLSIKKLSWSSQEWPINLSVQVTKVDKRYVTYQSEIS